MTSKNTVRSHDHKDKVFAHAYLAELQDLTLAAQIRVLREQRDWSQQELAEFAGMAQARVSLLESADYSGRTLTTLRKLAAAFDVGLCVSFVPYFREIQRLETGTPVSLRVPSRGKEHKLGISTQTGIFMEAVGGYKASGRIENTPTSVRLSKDTFPSVAAAG